jgi:uncharacterized membrane protein
MKTLIKILPVLILFLFPPALFCQPELEEVPMFGTSKSIDAPKTHMISIKNTGKEDLTIISVQFPENVKVSLSKEKLSGGETATLYITFDPEVIKTDNYSATIKVISVQAKPGLKTSYESTYDIKGSFMF